MNLDGGGLLPLFTTIESFEESQIYSNRISIYVMPKRIIDARPGTLNTQYPTGNTDLMPINAAQNLWSDSGTPLDELPTDPVAYDNAADRLIGHNYGFLDIEHWPTSEIWSPASTQIERQKYRGYLKIIYDEIKGRVPNVKLGFWGTVGQPGMTWPVSAGFQTAYAEHLEWFQMGFPQTVDIFFLPQYYYGQDINHFIQKIKAEKAIARAYGNQPIFSWIWHRRVDQFDGGDTSDNSIIPAGLWDDLIFESLKWMDGIAFWQHPFEPVTQTVLDRLQAISLITASLN